MAFSIYEVIRVTCQSRSWFVYIPREIGRKQARKVRVVSTLYFSKTKLKLEEKSSEQCLFVC